MGLNAQISGFGLNKLAALVREQKLEDGSQVLPLDPGYPYFFENFPSQFYGAEPSLPEGMYSDFPVD